MPARGEDVESDGLLLLTAGGSEAAGGAFGARSTAAVMIAAPALCLL